MENVVTLQNEYASRALGKTAVVVSLGAMALFIIGLSVFFFMPQSLRLDEAQSLWQSGMSPVQIFSVVAQDVHVPLYHEMLHFWRLYVGDGVASARFLSLIFYLLSLPAIYLLGNLAYSPAEERATARGQRIGLCAALFLAVSPFMNWYGNEIRMYTLFMLLTILNQYFFIRLWKRPSNDTWIGYGATALAGVFTHYFFFLNLIAQAGFYFWRRNLFQKWSLRGFMVIWILILAAFIPWGWYVLDLGQAANQVPLLAIPTTVDLFNTFSQFILGFQTDHVNTVFLSLWPATLLIAFIALRRARLPGYETQYFMLTIIVSFVIAFGFSVFVQPVFVSRYLIFTVPALYLILSEFFANYTPQVAPYALASVMLIMMGIEIASPATPVKENYEPAVAYLNSHAAPQDIVAIAAPFTLYPVEYYYRAPAPLTTLPAWDQYAHGAIPAFSASTLPAQVNTLANAHQNIWLLLSYDQGYNQTIREYFDSHYQRLLTENFSPELDLYEYQIGYGTPIAQASTTAMR